MLSLLSFATDLAVEKIELFMLVLVRISFIIFILPVFNHTTVPTSVKAILSLTLAFLVFPQIPNVGFVIADSTMFFMMLVLEQVFIGMLIGFTGAFLWYFLTIGGYFIARDLGLMAQGGMNPLTNEPGDYVSALLIPIFIVVFLASGQHYFFIRVLFESFQYIPMGHLGWDTLGFAAVITLLSASAFVVALKMAAPVMVVSILTTVVLGLMNRVMPRMSVWILGIPIKVTAGLIVLITTLPMINQLFESNFEQVQRALLTLLKMGGPYGV
jgi:flagellar biosynthetic protein FliR